eukprot:TRINITY_DN7669_c0_g2_i1.p1 TRINITY_DN7669_c0_g2~~TRINITY_DN7669_c0_g2_i1.p1  ORF type:complete len:452 (+),score=130.38 TRINITY_DN7669_c0_g2_i1:37-1356(+)
MSVPFTDKSDIYSLGIVYWEVINAGVTGQYSAPYSEHDQLHFSAIIFQISQGLRPTLPVNTPPMYKKLYEDCIGLDPTTRLSALEALQSMKSIVEDHQQNPDKWKNYNINYKPEIVTPLEQSTGEEVTPQLLTTSIESDLNAQSNDALASKSKDKEQVNEDSDTGDAEQPQPNEEKPNEAKIELLVESPEYKITKTRNPTKRSLSGRKKERISKAKKTPSKKEDDLENYLPALALDKEKDTRLKRKSEKSVRSLSSVNPNSPRPRLASDRIPHDRITSRHSQSELGDLKLAQKTRSSDTSSPRDDKVDMHKLKSSPDLVDRPTKQKSQKKYSIVEKTSPRDEKLKIKFTMEPPGTPPVTSSSSAPSTDDKDRVPTSTSKVRLSQLSPRETEKRSRRLSSTRSPKSSEHERTKKNDRTLLDYPLDLPTEEKPPTFSSSNV